MGFLVVQGPDIEDEYHDPPRGTLAERAAAFLSALHGECYGDGEALEQDLAWLEAQAVQDKTVAVAVGNERAFSFYARFGFYPRLVVLKQVRT